MIPEDEHDWIHKQMSGWTYEYRQKGYLLATAMYHRDAFRIPRTGKGSREAEPGEDNGHKA